MADESLESELQFPRLSFQEKSPDIEEERSPLKRSLRTDPRTNLYLPPATTSLHQPCQPSSTSPLNTPSGQSDLETSNAMDNINDAASDATHDSLADSTYEIISESAYLGSDQDSRADGSESLHSFSGASVDEDGTSTTGLPVDDASPDAYRAVTPVSDSEEEPHEHLERAQILPRQNTITTKNVSDMEESGMVTDDMLETPRASFSFNQITSTLRPDNSVEFVREIASRPGVVVPGFALDPEMPKPFSFTIRQTLAKDALKLDRPFRLLYHGPPEHKDAIAEKIAQALSIGAGTVPSSSRFNIVQVSSFGQDKASPQVMLIPSSGMQLQIEVCQACSSPQTSVHGPFQMRPKPTISGGRLQSDVFDTVGPSGQVPDLAVRVYRNPVGNRDKASLEASYKGVPTIDIFETAEGMRYCRYRPYKLEAVHVAVESRGSPHYRDGTILNRIPLDLMQFLALDAQQLNLNLARIVNKPQSWTSRVQSHYENFSTIMKENRQRFLLAPMAEKIRLGSVVFLVLAALLLPMVTKLYYLQSGNTGREYSASHGASVNTPTSGQFGISILPNEAPGSAKMATARAHTKPVGSTKSALSRSLDAAWSASEINRASVASRAFLSSSSAAMASSMAEKSKSLAFEASAASATATTAHTDIGLVIRDSRIDTPQIVVQAFYGVWRYRPEAGGFVLWKTDEERLYLHWPAINPKKMPAVKVSALSKDGVSSVTTMPVNNSILAVEIDNYKNRGRVMLRVSQEPINSMEQNFVFRLGPTSQATRLQIILEDCLASTKELSVMASKELQVFHDQANGLAIISSEWLRQQMDRASKQSTNSALEAWNRMAVRRAALATVMTEQSKALIERLKESDKYVKQRLHGQTGALPENVQKAASDVGIYVADRFNDARERAAKVELWRLRTMKKLDRMGAKPIDKALKRARRLARKLGIQMEDFEVREEQDAQVPLTKSEKRKQSCSDFRTRKSKSKCKENRWR